MISVSAVGSLREEFVPGDVVVPDQIFDRTKGNNRRGKGEQKEEKRRRAEERRRAGEGCATSTLLKTTRDEREGEEGKGNNEHTGIRPLSFFGEGVAAHVQFDKPFDFQLSQMLELAAKEAGANVHALGTYL